MAPGRLALTVHLLAALAVAACSPVPIPSPPPPATPDSAPVPATTQAQVADFYRGKTVRIVVGTPPGGGFDLTSRLLAERLPAYLPGEPTVIVENRPGAGGMIAANTVYTTEPKDGTVILSFVSSIVIRQLLGQPGVSFDAGKFQWLGAAQEDTSACLVRADTGVRSLEEAVASDRELVLGTGGPGNDSHDVPAVLASELGARLKLVSGYAGFSELRLATERKEIDGFCISFTSMLTNLTQWLEGDQPLARIVAIMGDTTPDHPTVRGLTPAERLAKSEESRQLMRLVNAGQRINKPFAVAPEVPPDRVEALRSALARAFADPLLLAKAETAKLVVAPLSAGRVTDYIQGLLRTPQPLRDRLRSIVEP